MGCGQSKIGIYQRKSKNKKNGSKRSAEEGEKGEDAEEEEEPGNCESIEPEDDDLREEDSAVKVKQVVLQPPAGGSVSAQSDISSSQLDFFKMLDEKIENGPDYEESDEEERKAKTANLLEEWREACMARQRKKYEEPESWTSPVRGGKPNREDFENYLSRRTNAVDTQRFPTGYSPCPPADALASHLLDSFRVVPPSFADPARAQPRTALGGNHWPFRPSPEAYDRCEDPPGYPLRTDDPPDPLRASYSQVLLRQSSINCQLQHYPESQRAYSENTRQFSDYPRSYLAPRAVPAVDVLREHRIYARDANSRPYQIYPDDPRRPEDVQRIPTEVPRAYREPHRQESGRPLLGNVENQRGYREILKEKHRAYAEGPRVPPPFQRPPLLGQRSGQEPLRTYGAPDDENRRFPKQDRFLPDAVQDGPASRARNPDPFEAGRSSSSDVRYAAAPPPPRETIPLQGTPGPPQGSPRPLVARGLQTDAHRLPANPVVHFRKPQGAFT